MKNVTGLILAGGRGQRMGGADKGWVVYEGRPLITSVVERLAPQVTALLISANRNVERYAALATVVEDDTSATGGTPFSGPLIGVLSGLRRSRTEWMAIAPCDAPHLPLDLVERLNRAASGAAASAACARVNTRLQPVFAVVRTDLLDHLTRTVAAGERAMHRWLESVGVVPVDFDEAEAFTNINSPATAG